VNAEKASEPVKIKCPKCGHEIQEDAGWLKVSSKVTCPVCLTMVTVRPQEGDGTINIENRIL
jgi:ribosomal protein S27E